MLRENSVCTLDNEAVNAIQPNLASNPQNVKNVEAIFPEAKFIEFFPNRDAAYTYENFLKAIGKYPAICSTTEHCPKILANMFGHFQQEVAGLFYLEEINKSPYCADWSAWVVEAYPCVSGKMYYGRGAKQLSWNYNYGAFSNAMFGDAMVLLEQPELVATTWLNFAASMWFFVTPQPPKPSMLQVLDGSWIPNDHDLASNLVPGFGVTTMIINGGIECGGFNQNAQNRANYYTDFAQRMGVDITGEKLLCNDMDQFSDQGSIGQMALYWSPNNNCELAIWQTAFSSLIEGDYNKCKGLSGCSTEASSPTTTAAPTTPGSTNVITTSSTSCSSGTICGESTSEPITDQIKLLRENSVCTLDNEAVNAIQPNLASNPQNVKNVEAIFPEAKFIEFFPNRDAAYTYENFLKAIGKYPAICSTTEHCPKILANMFGHFQQEVAGLFYLEEINKSPYCADWSAWVVEAYPCVSGKMYYGRGAKQLSWNYNYGAFSNAMFGDAMVLLEQPELVATTWLNFAASMWFFVTPQPPKPSMLQVLDGSWIPNDHDLASNLVPGFGVTTMIINGGIECGGFNQNAQNRANYYTDFAQRMGVDITGEKLLCNDMDQFSDQGSIGQMALYWSPNNNCELAIWQTAFSSLIEGDYNKCKGLSGCSTTTVSNSVSSTSISTGESTACIENQDMKVVCYYPNWPYYRNGKERE